MTFRTEKLITRKDKLVYLQRVLDLETEELIDTEDSESNYQMMSQKKRIDFRIHNCKLCAGLNIKCFTQAVCGEGNLQAKIFFIGESPCTHSMLIQMPFAWKSGSILNTILSLSNITRQDVFISNAIHCHLRYRDKPSGTEMKNCRTHLRRELKLIKPELIIAMGNFAKTTLAIIYPKKTDNKRTHRTLNVKHPASFLYNPSGTINYMIKVSLAVDKYK